MGLIAGSYYLIGGQLSAESIGQSPSSIPSFVGVPGRATVHLTAELLEEIADEMIREEIAEVDIDPEAFDLPEDRPKPKKKDSLDEVEFISEGERIRKVGF